MRYELAASVGTQGKMTKKRAGPAFPVARRGRVGAQIGLFAVGERSGSRLAVKSVELTAPGVGPY